MTHDLCGRRCRCTDDCCLKDDRCICQVCAINSEDGFMLYPTPGAGKMTHITPGEGKRLNHLTGRGKPAKESLWPDESLCRGCGRLVPLNRLVIAGEGDTFSEAWELAVHKADGSRCPGSKTGRWVPGPGEFAALIQRLKQYYPA